MLKESSWSLEAVTQRRCSAAFMGKALVKARWIVRTFRQTRTLLLSRLTVNRYGAS
jgi:hypothetical protein